MTPTIFDALTETMDCNGYAYFDNDAFNNKTDKVCYIPENAEDLEDCFNYEALKSEVENWLENNPDYLEEHETTVEAIVTWMYEELSWEFPSTWLDSLDY